ECAVIGVQDPMKGQVPCAFVVMNAGVTRDSAEIEREVIELVRQRIGPVAAMRTVLSVARLPKTRSGKILRSTMQKIADGLEWKMPATIDDPETLDEIREALRQRGMAVDARSVPVRPACRSCRSGLGAPVDPELRGREIADDEVEMFDREGAPAGRNRRARTVGDLHDRPAGGDARQEILDEGDALVHRRAEQRHRRDHAVENKVAVLSERGVEVEGIALDDAHPRKLAHQ